MRGQETFLLRLNDAGGTTPVNLISGDQYSFAVKDNKATSTYYMYVIKFHRTTLSSMHIDANKKPESYLLSSYK